MRSLIQYITGIGIFMICAQVLIHFRPDGSYEKYLKLLVSIMILIQLVSPILQLVRGEWDLEAGLASLEQHMAWLEIEAQETGREADLILEELALLQWKELGREEAGEKSIDKGDEMENDDQERILWKPVEPVIVGPIEPDIRGEAE